MSSSPYIGTITVGTGTVTEQTTITTIQSDLTSPSKVTITSPLVQILQLSGSTGDIMSIGENTTIQGSLALTNNGITPAKLTTQTISATGTASFTNMNVSGKFMVQGVDVLALRNQIMQFTAP